MARDNRLFYAVIGCLTGPLGGAVAGYYYARNQQRLAALDPSEGDAGSSKALNIVIGLLIGPIAGAGFGWGCGVQERKIDKLEQQLQFSNAYGPRPMRDYGMDMAMAQSQSKWQDQVAQQRAQMTDLQR